MKNIWLVGSLLLSSVGFSQSDVDQLNGTWVYVKIMVNGKQMESVTGGTHSDTIFIADKAFEQRCWIKDEKSLEQSPDMKFEFKQSGEMVLEKKKLIIVKRTTSLSDQGPPPDVYYRYKLKNDVLIISNPSVLASDKVEDDLVRMHYRKLR